jgi:hypothetical protein
MLCCSSLERVLKCRARARVCIRDVQFTHYTALMAAAKSSNVELVKLLLKSGADPLMVELVRLAVCSRADLPMKSYTFANRLVGSQLIAMLGTTSASGSFRSTRSVFKM